MLVSQVYSHKYVRYFAYEKIYIVCHEVGMDCAFCSTAPSRGSAAPPAPNVETPLHVLT